MNTINNKRLRTLKERTLKNGPVIYFMSREHRIENNWTLIFAQKFAMEHKLPLIVACPVAVDYPGISERQLNFLIQGLKQVEKGLTVQNIPFIACMEPNESGLLSLIRNTDAGAIFLDFNPLKENQLWKNKFINKINIPVYEVDAHNIIPCWEVSDKQEYAAYTIRPKIKKKIDQFLTSMPRLIKHPFPLDKKKMQFPNKWKKLEHHRIGIGPNSTFHLIKSGESAANERLQNFLSYGLSNYNLLRNNPAIPGQSNLSPYLHFGQISAQQVVMETQPLDSDLASQESFLEELIIRRELSDNFCFYNKNYDSFNGFPNWAQITLNEHRNDPRPYLYDKDRLESAETHDDLWNAAQDEMVLSGKMSGYIRMYWAKKILEWMPTPEKALSTAVYLNNKYELDGFDPNGYAGIAWSIGGVHDRAWSERDVFGKIRYMSYNGCRRKFSVESYINRIAKLKRDILNENLYA